MRDIVSSSFLNDMFLMVGSADGWTGITSLGFTNSGDLQLSKAGGAFVDITSACTITERGFGWYNLASSDGTHADTIGRQVIHVTESDSVSAIPGELLFNVTNTNVDSLAVSVANLSTGIAQGRIIVPTNAVTQDSPLIVYQKTHFDASFPVGQVFSSFATDPVFLSAKARIRDSAALWSVLGSVTNATSMSCVFSLHPTSHTNIGIGDDYFYEVQFQATTPNSLSKVAMVGDLEIRGTLKK